MCCLAHTLLLLWSPSEWEVRRKKRDMADILEVGLAIYVLQLHSEGDPRVAHSTLHPSSLHHVLLTALLTAALSHHHLTVSQKHRTDRHLANASFVPAVVLHDGCRSAQLAPNMGHLVEVGLWWCLAAITRQLGGVGRTRHRCSRTCSSWSS